MSIIDIVKEWVKNPKDDFEFLISSIVKHQDWIHSQTLSTETYIAIGDYKIPVSQLKD